jgi:hypothetical protein
MLRAHIPTKKILAKSIIMQQSNLLLSRKKTLNEA